MDSVRTENFEISSECAAVTSRLVLMGFQSQSISLERTRNRSERRRGLLGRDGLAGVLLIDRCRSVHTVGMRFPIDVGFVSLNEGVLRINEMLTMRVGRFGMPRFRSNGVLEAQAGSFERWGLSVGQRWSIES